MKRFTDALAQSVKHKVWHAALALSLTIPEICAAAERPGKGISQERYAGWWDRFVAPKYNTPGGRSLSGDDAFALRCAYLHTGYEETGDQKASDILKRFVFIAGGSNHNGRINQTLVLDIERFCADVTSSVEDWLVAVADDKDVQLRLTKLLTVHTGNVVVDGVMLGAG